MKAPNFRTLDLNLLRVFDASGRALLLPRRRPGQRTPLWMQRQKSADQRRYAPEPALEALAASLRSL